MSSSPWRKRCWVEPSRWKGASMPSAGTSTTRRSTSTVISRLGSASMASQEPVDHLGLQLRRHEAVLRAVVAEDVGEAGRDHHVEAVVLDGPDRVLPARPGAEVVPGHQHGGADEALVVEHEVAVVAPLGEQALAEAGALHALEPVARDDLVGVDVGAGQRHRRPADGAHGLHARSSGVAKWPATAVAAATPGETRWVRPPRPWRPSKLRFDVLARPLAGLELVGVHGQAHRAARLAPVEAGGPEHEVEALGLGLGLHGVAARHHHGPLHRDGAAVDHGGRGAEVLDAAVGARADEHGVDGDVAHGRAGGEAHVGEGPLGRLAAGRRRRSRPGRGRRRRWSRPGWGWCPS